MEARKDRANHVESAWNINYRVNRWRDCKGHRWRARTIWLLDDDGDRRRRIVCRLLHRPAVWLDYWTSGQFAASGVHRVCDWRRDPFADLSHDSAPEKVTEEKGSFVRYSALCDRPRPSPLPLVPRSVLVLVRGFFSPLRSHPIPASRIAFTCEEKPEKRGRVRLGNNRTIEERASPGGN
jgi:hypothetical protein